MRNLGPLFFVFLMLPTLIGCSNQDDVKPGDQAAPELATVCLDELCGYVNSQGEWQIPPRFRAADPFSKEGLARVIVKDGFFKSGMSLPSHGNPWSDMPYDGSLGLIDVNGNFVLQPQFGAIRDFAGNGLAAVKMNGPESEEPGSVFDHSYKWGFADTKGHLIIEATFDAVGDFSDDGLAPAQVDGHWGFIDSAGQWVISPQFDALKPFLDSGLALAREYKYEGPESEWQRPRSIGKWGFIDAAGQWAVTPVFDYVEDFFDTGLAVAVANNQSGMINSSGQWLIEPEFSEIWFPMDSSPGQAITTRGKSALISTSGQWITEPILDDLGWGVYSGEKVTSASSGGKEGLITVETGRWRAEAKFDKISEFNDRGLATVKLNEKIGLINIEGELIMEPKFHQLQAEESGGLFADGVRTLFNPRGSKILTIEDAGRVAKNAAGEIIWAVTGLP